MAIIWRLSWPKLLLLFVWLCLALEPNDAGRLESRLKKIDREIAVVSRLMNVTDESLLMMQLEAKNDDNSTRISTGSDPESNSQQPRSLPSVLDTPQKCKPGYFWSAGHCRQEV